jgi:hypothetical protein
VLINLHIFPANWGEIGEDWGILPYEMYKIYHLKAFISLYICSYLRFLPIFQCFIWDLLSALLHCREENLARFTTISNSTQSIILPFLHFSAL